MLNYRYKGINSKHLLSNSTYKDLLPTRFAKEESRSLDMSFSGYWEESWLELAIVGFKIPPERFSKMTRDKTIYMKCIASICDLREWQICLKHKESESNKWTRSIIVQWVHRVKYTIPLVSTLLEEAALFPKTDSKSTFSSPVLCGGGTCGGPYPAKDKNIVLICIFIQSE